jgi:hypothetical protein
MRTIIKDPKCHICGERLKLIFFDAKTSASEGLMCFSCYGIHGKGIGFQYIKVFESGKDYWERV